MPLVCIMLTIGGGGATRPFQGMGVGAWQNSTETQQFGPCPKVWTIVKNGRSSAKDAMPQRFKSSGIEY